MALLDVQRALTDLNRTCRIVSTQRKENITVYLIRLEINSYFWTVCHRYSEFYDLNEKLVNNHNLDKSLLPPKKLFGKNSDAFIQKRQNALESYLHGAIAFFLSKDQNIPAVLRDFFDFQKYEVHGVTQTLAESFYHYGDSILAAGSLFTLNPLHLSSITERLKLAVPTYVVESKSKDLGHLLDFASQLVRLRIEGSDATVGTSNLIMNRLLFDLSYFKNIKELQIYNCDMKSLKGVGNMRSTVKKLTIKNSIENLRDLLLCDVIHWPPDDAEKLNSCWTGLEVIQFSFNKLKDMDESITLLVNISEIDLSHNQLTEIKNLETLNKLNCLNLSSNHISSLDSLHTKLGNIRCLNLASNRIASISGLSKLYSLEYLDLSHNIIEDISEIEHLSHLPCLEALKLFKNPVTTVVDYRIKVLVCFAQRINELALDNHATTQKEKDTVAVIHAIKVSKERSNYTEDTSSVEQCDQPSSTQQVSSCNPGTFD